LAPPSTDLGRLQRGLGSVLRRAFTGQVSNIDHMLVDCVVNDPRWHSSDARADSYARLAIYLEIDPTPFEAAALVQEAEDHDVDPGTSLPALVVTRMATLGHAEALAAEGRRVQEEAPLGGAARDRPGEAASVVTPREYVAGLTTHEILRLNDPKYVWAASRALQDAASDGDLGELLRVASDRSLAMHAPAVLALASRGHVEVLPAALEFPTGNYHKRRMLFRAFTALPYEATGTLAIEWLSGDDALKRRAGAAALAGHSTLREVELLRHTLAAEVAVDGNEEQNLIGSLATALGRHPAAGPFPELVAAFEAIAHSSVRAEIVEALAATDPTFATEIAVDCLWDAEPQVRRIAAQQADRRVPAAAARLEQLHLDLFEDVEVRAAAAPS
jgi:hypothetical protein